MDKDFGGGDELLLHIFSFLSFADLRLVAPTCRRFALIANDESLWRSFCFGNLPPGCRGDSDPAPLVSSLFRSFITREVEGSGRCNPWRWLFRFRFWIHHRAQALTLRGSYSQTKADTLCALMEVALASLSRFLHCISLVLLFRNC
jgi:hypothetical protein